MVHVKIHTHSLKLTGHDLWVSQSFQFSLGKGTHTLYLWLMDYTLMYDCFWKGKKYSLKKKIKKIASYMDKTQWNDYKISTLHLMTQMKITCWNSSQSWHCAVKYHQEDASNSNVNLLSTVFNIVMHLYYVLSIFQSTITMQEKVLISRNIQHNWLRSQIYTFSLVTVD